MTAEFELISFSDGFDTGGLMATITIQLSGSALPGLTGTPTKTYTISDTDLQSLMAWATSAYGNPNQTPAQVLVAWLTGQLINPTVASVQGFQRSQQIPPSPVVIS